MNYRHAYHAGNFADLLKHAVLTALLRSPRPKGTSLTVIDTHAGAGVYDLSGPLSRRTGESDAGIGRLMLASDAPRAFDDLKAAVRRANPAGGVRFYPGSPVLIEASLTQRDHFFAFELRPDDHAALKGSLARQTGAVVTKGDGWARASERVPTAPNPVLALIDPPFEQSDDAEKAVQLAARMLRRNRSAVVAIWTPIKDLTGFDALLGAIEDAIGAAPLLVVEVRLRPLGDPMRLNGCAVLVTNPPASLDEPSLEAARWIAATMGATGGQGRIQRLNHRAK